MSASALRGRPILAGEPGFDLLLEMARTQCTATLQVHADGIGRLDIDGLHDELAIAALTLRRVVAPLHDMPQNMGNIQTRASRHELLRVSRRIYHATLMPLRM